MVGFITESGTTYAGKHLLLDLYDCEDMSDMETIEKMLVNACIATGATVLFSHSHLFPGGGSSGAVILAESHATFHVWQEERVVCIDCFVCGNCDPEKIIKIVIELFKPKKIIKKIEKRCVI
jgi:S-adenosylmethionine decarboxylase